MHASMSVRSLARAAQCCKQRCSLGAFALCVVLSACGGEDQRENVPPAAEIELGQGGEEKLEDATPLTDDDIGEVVVATGEVVGNPLPNGFFLRTGANEVVFVASEEQVRSGEQVRTVGPLARVEAATFRGWRVDALEGTVQAEWDVLDTYYITATSVSKL